MKQIVFFFIIAELFLSCQKVKNDTNNRNGKTMETSSEESYYFQMDTVRQKKIFENVSLLSIGDTVTKVINVIGNPDNDQVGMKKEKDQFICRILTFYIARWRKELVNEKRDRSIRFILDKNNRIIKIESNVEGHKFTKSINDLY